MAYYIIHKNCNQCKNCLDVCMNGAILDLCNSLFIDPIWCCDCGSCEAMCHLNAISYMTSNEDIITQNEEISELEWYFSDIL